MHINAFICFLKTCKDTFFIKTNPIFSTNRSLFSRKKQVNFLKILVYIVFFN